MVPMTRIDLDERTWAAIWASWIATGRAELSTGEHEGESLSYPHPGGYELILCQSDGQHWLLCTEEEGDTPE